MKFVTKFRLFKDNFEFEHYLDILPDKDRITYCRFRTGNHRLPTETGRWHSIEQPGKTTLEFITLINLQRFFSLLFCLD
jgi:hypothetical protein